MTSYCEDCLPQDEIEGLGRYKAFEELGYISKQAYYIRCPVCIADDTGVDIDEGTMLLTQQMPVHVTQQEDEEDEEYLKQQQKDNKKSTPTKTTKGTTSTPSDDKGSTSKSSKKKEGKGSSSTGKKVGRPRKMSLENGDTVAPAKKKSKKK